MFAFQLELTFECTVWCFSWFGNVFWYVDSWRSACVICRRIFLPYPEFVLSLISVQGKFFGASTLGFCLSSSVGNFFCDIRRLDF